MAGFAVITVGMLWAPSCAALAEGPYVSRPAPNSHVLLVPELQGGTAGWCMATATETATEGSSGCGAPRTSTGPIFAQGDCQGNDTKLDTFVLTTGEVAAVSVAGGPPIPTHANSTLPDGLRAAAIEVLRNQGKPWPCPLVTPLAANGRPIRKRGITGKPLLFRLPGTQRWTESAPSTNWRLQAHRDSSTTGNRGIRRGRGNTDQALPWAARPRTALVRGHRLYQSRRTPSHLSRATQRGASWRCTTAATRYEAACRAPGDL